MSKAVLITIALAAPAAALLTSYIEDRLQYNLFDLLKDKFNALLGRVVLDAQVTIKVTRSDLEKVEAAVLGMPNRIKAAVRRRV
jgi:peptidoglycan/LPS O-acetylase OafA/YrhL